jgi:hypothetical protein
LQSAKKLMLFYFVISPPTLSNKISQIVADTMNVLLVTVEEYLFIFTSPLPYRYTQALISLVYKMRTK